MKKLLAAVILCWVMVFLVHFDSFYFIENALADKLTVKVRPVDPRLKILAIDDDSLEKIGRFPWPRDKMAELIDKVAAAGATAVWPDMLFTEPSSDPKEDQALAEVVKKYDNVYLPVYFDFQALQKPTRQMEQEYLKLPVINIPPERIGHINILPDNDNIVRKMLLGIPNLKEEIVPLIDVRLANLLLPEDSKITWDKYYNWQRGQEKIAIDEKLQVSFVYATSSDESKFEVIPAWRVMEGEIDPAYFKGSLVLIGPYAAGLQEQYNTPISGSKMYEVEIHANIIQALLDNELYTKTSKSRTVMIIILVSLLSFALFTWAKAKRGAVVLALLILGYSGVVYYFYNTQQVLLPYFYVLLAIIVAYGATVAGEYIQGQKDRKKMKEIVGRYVSDTVFEKILLAKEKISFSPVRKDVTLMFVELKGFIKLSQKLEPKEVVGILNQFIELCTKVIFEYEGTLVKVSASGVSSLFGAPLNQEDHPERAVRAALDLREKAEDLIEQLQNEYGQELSLAIGINTGPVVIGNVGSADHFEYLAIGDTVQWAARLGSGAKGGQILISKETYQRIEEIFECTALDPLIAKGKEKAEEIYQVEREYDEYEDEYDEDEYDEDEYDEDEDEDDEYYDDENNDENISEENKLSPNR
ncbi:MAG TPA: CHASE2 domain-containing protein [Peptococcaceae bacterium]|nr:CHASE2 domain-containing protein [Peptococcaceae bacterium]